MTKGQTYGKALYPIFSHINHDCLANAKYKIDINSWEVQVRAQKPISKGEEITIQYLSTVLGTHKRRKRIKGNVHDIVLLSNSQKIYTYYDPTKC